MSEPWDRPPFPKRGNVSSRVLYEAIGRAVMSWEEVEVSLAHLYGAFCEVSRFDQSKNREYGEPHNFKDRLKALVKKSNKYFSRHPNQTHEGKFKNIVIFADGYSQRRNDTVHGHVIHVHWLLNPTSTHGLLTAPIEWCVVPPHFSAKKFTVRNVPAYAFSSREINKFVKAFWDIALEASRLSADLDVSPPPSGRKFFPLTTLLSKD